LNNVFNTWSAFIQAKKDFKTWFIFSAINTILAYSAIFLTLYITRSFVWVIFISMTSSFLINIILFLITLKIYKPNNIKDEENVNSYGLHLSLVSIPTLLSNQLDSILIFHLIGPVQLAIYSLATLIPEKLAGGLKFISTIALPKFAERKEDELKNTITQKTLIILVALIVCMVIYIILIPIFFPIFFPRYLESIPYTQIYSLTIVSVAVGFVQAAMMAHKRTKELYTTSITGAIIKSALMIALIFPFGIWGVLWAQILNQVIILGISLTLFKRESRSIN
jgi:O-antigen/teichoic acid export membrane protein